MRPWAFAGKALFGLLADIRADPGAWRGRRILFIHTGGLFGLYDKESQLLPLIAGSASPLDVQ